MNERSPLLCFNVFFRIIEALVKRGFFFFFSKHPFCSLLCCEPGNISQIDAWKMKTATSGTEITSLGTSGLSQIYDFLGSWQQSQNVKINSSDAV